MEDGFYDIIIKKRNCLDIELEMTRFLNSRKENEYVAIDAFPDSFHDKTVFLYFEVNGDKVENMSMKRID